MHSKQRDFDKEASSWDDNPMRIGLANDIADGILHEVILTSEMDVLDFGCGTGLVTLRLQPYVHSITAVDSSEGMLAVLQEKITKQDLTNVQVEHVDRELGEAVHGTYHLVISSMTLHHIEDISSLLGRFYRVMVPGANICIADLESEEGLFHEDNQGVFHFGFDRKLLKAAFITAGFSDIVDRSVAEVTKPTAKGETRRFNVFLMTARK